MSTHTPLHEPQLGDKMATKSEEKASTVLSKKRKRGTATGEKPNKFTETGKKQRTAAEEDDLDLSMGINKSFTHMDSQLIADYVTQQTRKFERDLSSVELEDRYISGNYAIT
jgi:protein CMS1